MRNRLFLSLLLQTVIIVHTLDGREVAVNTHAITTFGRPSSAFTDDVNCVLTLVDRRFVSTKETCEDIVTLMAKAPTGGYLDAK